MATAVRITAFTIINANKNQSVAEHFLTPAIPPVPSPLKRVIIKSYNIIVHMTKSLDF